MYEQATELREAQARRSCERYAARLTAGRGGLRRDGNAEAQAANYAAGNLLLSRLRSATADVLDKYGVPTIVRPYYYSFILALAKRDRILWSEVQRRNEGRILVSLWTSRGLKREVLLAITQDVLLLNLADTESEACTSVKA
jgi:hypothetical protein